MSASPNPNADRISVAIKITATTASEIQSKVIASPPRSSTWKSHWQRGRPHLGTKE
jgi:hypothetical protein